MGIHGFNLDVLEPYYLSKLIKTKFTNPLLYDCGLTYIIDHNRENDFFDRIRQDPILTVEAREELLSQVLEILKKGGLHNIESCTVIKNIIALTSQLLSHILEELYSQSFSTRHTVCSKEEMFKTCYGLNNTERDIIRFFYYITVSSYAKFIHDPVRIRKRELWKIISDATGIPYENVNKNLIDDSRLVSTHIIFINNESPSFFYQTPYLATSVTDYIESTHSEKSLIQKYSFLDDSSTYPIDSFPVSAHQTQIALQTIGSGQPFQILLYGEPGTGKTEYARSLSHSLSMRSRFVLHGTNAINDKSDRFWALHVAINLMSENDLLIVDEADAILNTEMLFSKTECEKGRLNTLFDTIHKPILWITNNIDNIHPSLLRRFAFSIRFNPMNASQRENVFKTEAQRLSINISDEQIKSIASRYDVNAAGISHALRISSILSGTEDMPSVFHDILDAHHLLIHGGTNKPTHTPISEIFNIDFINTDIPINRLIRAGSLFHGHTFIDSTHNRICSLFYGIPGTGKSETARYIAEKIKMPIIQKRYSDLITKYVGDAERNIANAFREAEENNSILFLDEADALFTERSGDQKSWEISRTNELLSQIDTFRGILICCTNLINLMDSAVFRRFSFKIQFLPIQKEKRTDVYHTFFKEHGELSKENEHTILGIETLTPGDLRAVAEKIKYEDHISHSEIIETLKTETKFKINGKVRKIGF